MNKQDIFQPSETIMNLSRTLIMAIKSETKSPDANPQLAAAWHMQMVVHVMLQTFDSLNGLEMDEAGVPDGECIARVQGAMTGIGVGLASYLSQTSAPDFFFEHIVVMCAKSLPSFTKTEGPTQ